MIIKRNLTVLEDLQAVLTDVQTRIDAIGLDVTFAPHEDVWEEVRSQYAARTSDAVSVVGNSLAIKTPNGNFLTISGQELPRIWAVLPYARALGVYEAKVDELARALGFASRSSARAKDDIFKKLPSDDWEAELKEEDAEAIRHHISQDLNLLPEDQERFLRFLQDAKWSGVAKTLERSDWRMAAIVGAGKWLANAATRRGELADALADSEIIRKGDGSGDRGCKRDASGISRSGSRHGSIRRKKPHTLRGSGHRKIASHRRNG